MPLDEAGVGKKTYHQHQSMVSFCLWASSKGVYSKHSFRASDLWKNISLYSIWFCADCKFYNFTKKYRYDNNCYKRKN
jgi:hypothetical protein